MPGPSIPAMDVHLQRYGTSDAGDDNDSDTHAPRGGGDADATSFWGVVFADTSHPLPNNVLARWWRQHHPFIAQFIHEYGSILVQYLTPFTPGAARRAGYCCASHVLRRSLDRVDVELPGAEGGWSSRWRSRCPKNRGTALPGRIGSVYTAIGGAGVAAVVVLLAAAASWCSWRRSPPSWPLLLGEVAIGSAGLAHYLARDDGYQEAKLLEAHVIALERSLGPFFRGVHACMRMVRCSQTLNFGLRLSVPMPPVARMERRLSAAGGSRPGQPEVALRELRSVLMDVLEGAVRQASAFENREGCAGTGNGGGTDGSLASVGQTADATKCQTLHALADLVGRETQLVADLRRFVAAVAAKVNGAMAEPKVWGLWWDSQLAEVSEAVKELAKYFEAGSERLEAAIGPCSPPLSASCGASHGNEVAAAAEAISSLRLHYEEIVVRLFSCQSNTNSILRDPTKSLAHLWGVVRRDLADARLSTGPLNYDHELWQKAEHLVKCNANDDQREADLNPGASSSENLSENSRHLEAGVGWVSLATPRGEGPCVFEGGSGDEGVIGTLQSKPDKVTGVTDVLVGMPSPGRSRPEGDVGAASTVMSQEQVDERSRAQLVGELDSVLRARPLPPTCEKHLPLESQHSLGGGQSSDKVGENSAEQPVDVSAPPAAQACPVAENMGNQNLMAELRAQLSLAANEEIFSAASGDEEDSTLVEDGKDNRDDDATGEMGR